MPSRVRRKFRIPVAVAALIALAGLVAAAGLPAAAQSGPFTDFGANWCPSYMGQYGCTSVQYAPQYTVSLDPAQVSVAGDGTISLTMGATSSGAVSTGGNETYGPGTKVSVTATIPCDSGGMIENWPAIWMNGTDGSWPAWGEIDLMEGLNNGESGTGYAYWHYHYLNAQGLPAYVGGQVPGNWCGEHTFAADYGTGAITYYYDGNQVGQVTAAEIGVPLASDPMNVIMDYAAGQYGGPTTPGAAMNVNSFSAEPDSSGSMTVTPPVSQANPQQVCDGAPLCLSNSGQRPGGSVRMNDPGNSNEDYQLQAVNACGGTDWVHYAAVDGWNCPFANASLDQAFDHLGIGQLTSSTPGLCVSSGTTGRAVLGTCADPSDGSGGAAGVLSVYSGDSSCLASNGEEYLVNQYWSDSAGAAAYLISGGGAGARAYFSATAPATCWSGL